MTMTLEQLRDELDGSALGTQERHVLIVDSIEAAIRERDRLRGDVAGMTEELLHVPSRDDWRELQQRAERAEAAQPQAAEPVAWRTFDGEGGYDYRSYEDNETYRDDYIKRNGPKYPNWVQPLYLHPQPLDQDAKDATRYRWTVAHWYDLEIILEQFGSLPPGAGSLTAMIDAAMAREAPDAT